MNASILLRDRLLTTKFFIPSPSHTLIPRSRLTAQLSASLQHKLTLASAPAGFGKTTLLAAWVQSLPPGHPHVAWVSLDEEDNEPLRFWEYALHPGLLDRRGAAETAHSSADLFAAHLHPGTPLRPLM